MPMFIILFGVTGAGKTTVGELLAKELNWPFYDADNYHPAANVEKMRQGIPLSEEDRKPWLESLHKLIKSTLEAGKNGILACSALKENYRQYLQVNEQVKFVYLRGNFSLIKERLDHRKGHYMNPSLLKSQFDTLEEPRKGELVVSIDATPLEITDSIREHLGI